MPPDDLSHPLHQLTCDSKPIAAFGPFVLSFRRRQLFRDAQLIRLGARALSTLIALVERHGAVVSKTVLQRIVWPNTHVDEGNLRVQICTLRRVLEDSIAEPRYISTSAGEGYIFIGELRCLSPKLVPVA
jgi:DNA-binding winged helix-turn-helix (wHTH) protein